MNKKRHHSWQKYPDFSNAMFNAHVLKTWLISVISLIWNNTKTLRFTPPQHKRNNNRKFHINDIHLIKKKSYHRTCRYQFLPCCLTGITYPIIMSGAKTVYMGLYKINVALVNYDWRIARRLILHSTTIFHAEENT